MGKSTSLPQKFIKYGIRWPVAIEPLIIEIEMIRMGGRYKRSDGSLAGEGLEFHFRKAQELAFPEKQWHRWAILEMECFLKYRYIGEMGAAAAGKTSSSASNLLMDWYCYPNCTTTLVCSTSLEILDLRAWGAIKHFHKMAKERYPWLPGNLIEGRRVIIYDPKLATTDGRDFKNGLVAVALKKGEAVVGLQNFVGVHNKRIRLLGDELPMMPRSFLDSLSNLSKCQDFKLIGLGNPNDTINAHGILCEPAAHLGGWEGGIDQTPKTKTWETRFPKGICIQLPGSDSPNMDVPAGHPPPYPYLITREQMEDDAKIWGTDDWHYKMFNDAMMPRGLGNRRFLTRQMCEKFHALDEPHWLSNNRTRIASLDAAYRGVGGDRCVFCEMQFGDEATTLDPKVVAENLLSQDKSKQSRRQIIALIDLIIIPIQSGKEFDLPEDQIVKFVMAECNKRKIPPENFFYDAGMRTSLVQAFSRLWSSQTNSIDCGGKPSEHQVSMDIDVSCRDYYGSFISELWYSVRLCIEAQQFRGLTQEAMLEFCAREWKKVSGNKIEAESKAELKKKTGRSPDLADATVQALWGARQRGFKIARLGVEQRRNESPWKRNWMNKAKQLWNASNLDHAA